MKRQRAVLLLALSVACEQRNEPMAGGKPLSHWKREATQVSGMTFWNSSKDERRHEAFRRLNEIGEPAVPALVDLFRQNRIPMTGDALNILTRLGPRAVSAVPSLVDIVKTGPPELRIKAVMLLGTIGPAAQLAVPLLTPLLQHADVSLRRVASSALAQIGGGGQLALERARTSTDPREREASLQGRAMQTLDSTSLRDLVTAGLADANPAVRSSAMELLMRVRREQAEALADHLIKGLNDPDPDVSKQAHRVFAQYLQRNGATPRLLAIVLKDGDAAARADAAWHLGGGAMRPERRGSSDDPFVLGRLVSALSDTDIKVRLYAGRALAYSEGGPKEQGIQTLRREMSKADPILGVRGARALWSVSRNVVEVKPVYEAGLADPNQWNRVETMSAIIELGKDAEVFRNQVERLLKDDPSAEVRDRAGKLLYAMNRRGR